MKFSHLSNHLILSTLDYMWNYELVLLSKSNLRFRSLIFTQPWRLMKVRSLTIKPRKGTLYYPKNPNYKERIKEMSIPELAGLAIGTNSRVPFLFDSFEDQRAYDKTNDVWNSLRYVFNIYHASYSFGFGPSGQASSEFKYVQELKMKHEFKLKQLFPEFKELHDNLKCRMNRTNKIFHQQLAALTGDERVEYIETPSYQRLDKFGFNYTYSNKIRSLLDGQNIHPTTDITFGLCMSNIRYLRNYYDIISKTPNIKPRYQRFLDQLPVVDSIIIRVEMDIVLERYRCFKKIYFDTIKTFTPLEIYWFHLISLKQGLSCFIPYELHYRG